MAKPLICKFVAKAAPVSDAAPSGDAVVANNVEDPPAAFIDTARLHCRRSLRRKPHARPCRRRLQAQKERSGALQGPEGPGLIETCLSLHKCD